MVEKKYKLEWGGGFMTKLDNFFLKATKQQQTGALFNKAGTLNSRGRVVIFNGDV